MDEDTTPVSMRRRVITTVVVLLVVWMGARFGFKALKSLRTESTRTGKGTPPPLVRVARATRGEHTEVLHAYGRARAVQRADVTAEVPGVVREVSPLLEAGTAIGFAAPAGTDGNPEGGEPSSLPVLVRLDARDLADRLAAAEAETTAAKAEITRLTTRADSLGERIVVAQDELDSAARELRRIAGLVPKTLPPSDLDRQKIQVSLRQQQMLQLSASLSENEAALSAARAQLLARERNADLARRDLERTAVRPPFPGRIEGRFVDVGERVRLGDPLFSIVNLTAVEVPVALPASRYRDVVVGATAELRRPDGHDALWTGRITRVAPMIQAEDRTFFAYVVVTGSPAQSPAPPGTHLLASVDGRTFQDVIAVPRQAFLGDVVYVAKRQPEGERATVERREPVVERMLPGVALVRSGLEDGEWIVLTNLESIAAGSTVRIAPEVEQAPGPDGR